MRSTRALLLGTVVILSAAAPVAAQAPVLDSTTLAGLRWRPIGPANMMGRVTDVEGIPFPSRTFYFASVAGGIYKTTNGGVTFRDVFAGASNRVISMGDLAIAPSDTNQVWAGTGEEDSRNSISPGGGIFRSTDGGGSWQFMGLKETEHIGRIVVHPTDPGTVWVAALGAAWRTNPERGLYKTTDGGRTWRKVLSVPGRESIAGAVDVAIHPRDPNTLYAATWERLRQPYKFHSGGPGSGLWKSTDGGETWARVTGGGFPTTTLGRIGIAVAPSNPDYVYLMVEADSLRGGARPAGHRQELLNGLYRSTDGGRTWERRAPNNVRPFYYSQVRVDPRNPERVYWSSTPVNFSDDGGKTVRQTTIGLHVDHHAMWIDPNHPDHIVVGNDGGIGITWDKGGNWLFPNSVALGQFYNISYDMAVPYRVCGGLQDNGSWCGPSRRANGSITNAHWATFNGGDGFVTAQDPTDPDIVYGESQGGNIARVNWRTGESTRLQKLQWRPRYMQWEDSVLIARPDTTSPATRELNQRIANYRRQQRTDSAEMNVRWNWNTPFFLSPHNPGVLYAAGNRVFKSTARGDDMRPISPDLSKRLLPKIDTSLTKTGGVTRDATGAEAYGTVVSLAESPLRPGILWAGTDDGNVWLSRTDGATWDQLRGPFPGLPDDLGYVSRIEPSQYDSATVYVSFDNHRRGDFKPYVYTSIDWGRTWRSISANLPSDGPDFVHVIREDPVNRDLLYVGTDVGAYVSTDRGRSWQWFMSGLAPVPVHDLKIHPRDRELIAGTHGRSIWIVDVAPLQQLTSTVAAAPSHLFAPRTAYQYGDSYSEGQSTGHGVFRAPSPSYGAEITYRVKDAQPGQARIVITDAMGDTMTTLTGPARAGVHRVVWNFRGRQPVRPALSPSERRDSVRTAERMAAAIDSLVTAGAPREALDSLRARMERGDTRGLGGGGGGGGARPGFQDRPGESSPPVARPAAAPRERAVGARILEDVDPDDLRDWMRALRGPGQGGGAGGGGSAPLVKSGDYMVTLHVGGRTHRQPLRVERTASIGANGDTADVAAPHDDDEP